MTEKINTEFIESTNLLRVRMPDYITESALIRWRQDLLLQLQMFSADKRFSLLLDVNTHNFESVDSLKFLRDLFTEQIIAQKIEATAFVCPAVYRKPEIVSCSEAYFESAEDALHWLGIKTSLL